MNQDFLQKHGKQNWGGFSTVYWSIRISSALYTLSTWKMRCMNTPPRVCPCKSRIYWISTGPKIRPCRPGEPSKGIKTITLILYFAVIIITSIPERLWDIYLFISVNQRCMTFTEKLFRREVTHS